MDTVVGQSDTEFSTHALTDLTLSLLQDTGWCALPFPLHRHGHAFSETATDAACSELSSGIGVSTPCPSLSLLSIRLELRVPQTAAVCRYDVKYGTAGFNPFGFHSGCTFALRSFSEASQDPAAARFLCTDIGALGCTHNGQSSGVCNADVTWNGFAAIAPVCSLLPLAATPGLPAGPSPVTQHF